MAHDLLTALALVLILEGFLPGVAPSAWMKMMRDLSRFGPQGIRMMGISFMVTGAVILHFLN